MFENENILTERVKSAHMGLIMMMMIVMIVIGMRAKAVKKSNVNILFCDIIELVKFT